MKFFSKQNGVPETDEKVFPLTWKNNYGFILDLFILTTYLHRYFQDPFLFSCWFVF